MPISFAARIERCRKKSNMTVSDLSRWFDMPRATVETWRHGRRPAAYYSDAIEHRLAHLEKLIGKGFAVPAELTRSARIKFVRERANGGATGNRRIPKTRAA